MHAYQCLTLLTTLLISSGAHGRPSQLLARNGGQRQDHQVQSTVGLTVGLGAAVAAAFGVAVKVAYDAGLRQGRTSCSSGEREVNSPAAQKSNPPADEPSWDTVGLTSRETELALLYLELGKRIAGCACWQMKYYELRTKKIASTVQMKQWEKECEKRWTATIQPEYRIPGLFDAESDLSSTGDSTGDDVGGMNGRGTLPRRPLQLSLDGVKAGWENFVARGSRAMIVAARGGLMHSLGSGRINPVVAPLAAASL